MINHNIHNQELIHLLDTVKNLSNEDKKRLAEQLKKIAKTKPFQEKDTKSS
jgi:hypothetical protein